MINSKIIRTLAIQELKHNRRKSIFATLAITLTTLLFTSLLTFGGTIVKSMESETMRQVGTSAHGAFKDLTDGEFEKLKEHPYIKEMGYRISLAMAANKKLVGRQTQIEYETDNYAEWGFLTPEVGSLPEKINEIATDTIVLDLLGIEHKIGAKLLVKYKLEDKTYTEEFILSGFWQGDSVAHSSMMLVSEEFIEDRLSGVDQLAVRERFGHEGLITTSFNFSNSFNIENKILKIIRDAGFSEDEIKYGVNWAYTTTNLSGHIESILFIIGALMVIMWTGYLIINNIFSISIINDIRTFGLFKTIGTTNRQIKNYMRTQALILSVMGLPLGLLLGFIIGQLLAPTVLVLTILEHIEYSVNPWILILSILFTLLTIYISSIRPGRIAAKITPIEGVKYNPTTSGYMLKRVRKSGISFIAIKNVLRQPRKTILVTLSIAFSLLLLNCIYSSSRSFDMDIYLKNLAVADFQVAHRGFFGHQQYSSPEMDVDKGLIHELEGQSWFSDGGLIRYQTLPHNLSDESRLYLQTYGYPEMFWEYINIIDGSFSREHFLQGDYVIVSTDFYEQNIYHPGDKIQIEFTEGNIKEYTVMAIADIPYAIDVQYTYDPAIEVYLPLTEFEKQFGTTSIMSYHFNTVDGMEGDANDYLKRLSNSLYPTMGFRSRELFKDEYAQLILVEKLIGTILVSIVALIGLLNMINSTLTSLHTRRREFALLESLGMTRKQLKRLIDTEGFYMGVLVILTTFLLIWITAKPFKDFMTQSWASRGEIYLLTTFISTPITILISIIISRLSFRYTDKSTIDVLRESE